jgi:heat shock protein HtpX
MLRIALFLATNFAVLVVLSIVLQLLGLNEPGSGTGGLLVMAAIFGMGGAFISLLMSKSIARRAVGAHVITEPRTPAERWLVDTVARQAQAAGIGMPEVAVFESRSPNAFATGAKRDEALVAVSTGLLQHMQPDEVEAVLAHEISHVANGDMVTLALIQGVLNTFVMVFAHVLAGIIDRDSRGRGFGYYIGYFAAQAVLGFLASLIVMWFSRLREYRADAGGAALAGRHKMIAALERLQRAQEAQPLPDTLQAFGITGGLGHLLSTHPPLSARIQALRELPAA